jgi:chorismate-pyruvate lyase
MPTAAHPALWFASIWLAASGAAAGEAEAWPDTYLARVQALALIQTINAEILGSRSATASLEKWCADHRLAAPPRIVAERDPSAAKPITAEQRQRLAISETEPVKYRRVRLRCGDRVLSEADNWYVPGRLDEAMNRQLDSTDTPFGKVVRPLEPYRRTLGATVLWSPLPSGWESEAPAVGADGGALAIPQALFEHRALVYGRDGTPFAEVHEVYQRALLDFAPARP